MKDEQVEGTVANDLIGDLAIDRVGVPSLWKVRHCRQSAYPRDTALTARPEPTPVWPANSILVRSPMVGTFYRAPSPGAPPFVEVGQTIEADTTVCIIEVMKLMSSILAGAQGTITNILAENGELVEHDQILMVIAPR